MKQNYLDLELEYLKGRCTIGNPPYGTKNNLTVAFYKKSLLLGDYISFILPISQYNNDIKLYEFDLLYSEDLGTKLYSNIKVHCCLNIYKRNTNGLNKKPNYKLQDVEIQEAIKNQDPKRNKVVTKDTFNYDLRVMAWGGGKKSQGKQLGCEVDFPEQYAKEFCIKINNNTYKNQIIDIIKNTIWSDIYPMTATPNLLQWQVYKYIKQQIPDIS